MIFVLAADIFILMKLIMLHIHLKHIQMNNGFYLKVYKRRKQIMYNIITEYHVYSIFATARRKWSKNWK